MFYGIMNNIYVILVIMRKPWRMDLDILKKKYYLLYNKHKLYIKRKLLSR